MPEVYPFGVSFGECIATQKMRVTGPKPHSKSQAAYCDTRALREVAFGFGVSCGGRRNSRTVGGGIFHGERLCHGAWLPSLKKILKRSVFYMETRYKLSTKVLSSFLAVLMAVSCFGIALPNLAPTASAAATTQDYKSLENAFDAVKEDDGSISASKYTVTAGEDGVTLIEDATSDGSIYKLAEALFNVASAENSGFKHNTLIRERIKTTLAKNGYTYTLLRWKISLTRFFPSTEITLRIPRIPQKVRPSSLTQANPKPSTQRRLRLRSR